ncbi:hypothetical protein MCAV_03110 [[Mycoplasma] cavipharyngis]|uniref:hypothetical protein n=1 Tax=[Mycoplasma] cavipharyngis TaxID=92757 RepID=UPI00370461AC
MNQVYYLNQDKFIIEDYQLKFQSAEYQWKVDAQFKILADFKFPPNTLKYNVNFPNKRIENNYLTYLRSCSDDFGSSNHSNLKCYLYKSSFNVILSDDKYFDSLMKNRLISGWLNFDIDHRALTKVPLEEKKINDDQFDRFLKNMHNAVQNFSFPYTNSYDLKKQNLQNEYQLKVLTDWTIYKNTNFNNYQYSSFNVVLEDKQYIVNSPIKKLITIQSLNNQIIQINQISSLVDYYVAKTRSEKTLEIKNDDLLISFNPTKTIVNISFKRKTIFENDVLEIAHNNGVNGIFIPYKSKGAIRTSLYFTIKGARVFLNLEDNFQFQTDFLITKKQNNLVNLKSLNWKPSQKQLFNYKRIEF